MYWRNRSKPSCPFLPSPRFQIYYDDCLPEITSEHQNLPHSPDYPCCLLLVIIRISDCVLGLGLHTLGMRMIDDRRDENLHFFTFNQEPFYTLYISSYLRHSTSQPSLCEYISATARHCVMEVSECVRIKPPFHPSSKSTMHSTQHWSQSQKLRSLLAFAKTFTQKGGLKVHACSSCEFI